MSLRPDASEFDDISEPGESIEPVASIDASEIIESHPDIPVDAVAARISARNVELANPLPASDWTGWVLVHKPVGASSFDVIRWIKHALRGLKPKPRIGHTGTLDPFAEGLLLVALGGATRLIPLLEEWPKTYRAGCSLGRETSTLDPEGELVREAAVPTLTREQVEAAFLPFIGSIWQTPPVFSALKQGGEALYRKARRGETVEVPPRLIHIDKLTLLDLQADRFEFEVTCGGGTYIRSLCRDLATALGTAGHCSALERTALGPLTLDDAWRIAGPEEVEPEVLHRQLRAPDWPLEEFPWISVGCSDARAFAHGNPLSAEEFHDATPGTELLRVPFRVYDAEGLLLGVAILESVTPPYVLQPKVVLVVPASD